MVNNFEVVVGPQNPNHLGDIRQANIRCHDVGIFEGRFREYCLPNSILTVLQSSSMLAYCLGSTNIRSVVPIRRSVVPIGPIIGLTDNEVVAFEKGTRNIIVT